MQLDLMAGGMPAGEIPQLCDHDLQAVRDRFDKEAPPRPCDLRTECAAKMVYLDQVWDGNCTGFTPGNRRKNGESHDDFPLAIFLLTTRFF